MLQIPVNQPKISLGSLFLSHKLKIVSGLGNGSLLVKPGVMFRKKAKSGIGSVHCSSNKVTGVETMTGIKPVTVVAVVRVMPTVSGLLSSLGLSHGLDTITDLLGKSLLLELVSADLNPETGLEKDKVTGYVKCTKQDDDLAKYEGELVIPPDFGEIGAVLVQNEHRKEMLLKDIVLSGFSNGPATFNCNSWVQSKFDNPEKRIFFTNKSYLPLETPIGLKKLRETELQNLRGNGEGERISSDRIYDYDKYNDLGNPDKSDDLARPVLGSKEYPYPRRVRTGRGPSTKDPLSEKSSSSVYVPRDEAFSEVKQVSFTGKTLTSVLSAALPSVETGLLDINLGFPTFKEIDALYDQGITLPKSLQNLGLFRTLLPRIVRAFREGVDDVLLFDAPELLKRDKFSWLSDKEFARQTLAGVNPYTIQLVTEWPLMSKLDPSIYGPPKSSITSELVEREIKGIMTIEEAIKMKKLFILDFHDFLLPFVNTVRELKGTTLYGSRTLFFLTLEGTLRPLAIELTRPPKGDKPYWNQVFTPAWDATNGWLWRLAKAHVCAHESGYHELVSHWLRTHCAVEPYIIAAHRQLSAMHPIYRLLHPHFRYTMQINAIARQNLINADGIIETSFSPGKYSMELSSAAYDQSWQFDMEALPADLIRRGMAIEDPTAEHGLKLTIEDYPFAADGIILWDAIKQWVSDYVNHHYPNSNLIESDYELQEFWTEVRTKGHADKKDEPWWPVLKTPGDLIQVLTTIIWVASAHHAAVNFAQYTYGGYFPNRPTIARNNMPTEDKLDEMYKNFLEKPERTLLQSFPTQVQATVVMAVLEVLSNHSSDEEYLGGQLEGSWDEIPVIKEAYKRFNGRLKELEVTIDARNADPNLMNRSGAGVVPYELLKPFSKAGVTGMGVPNSVSI